MSPPEVLTKNLRHWLQTKFERLLETAGATTARLDLVLRQFAPVPVRVRDERNTGLSAHQGT
jgi:hypothetical protein